MELSLLMNISPLKTILGRCCEGVASDKCMTREAPYFFLTVTYVGSKA